VRLLILVLIFAAVLSLIVITGAAIMRAGVP